MFRKNEVKVFDFSDPGLWVPAYLRLNWAEKRYKLLYGSRGRGGTTNVVQTIAMRMLSETMKGMMVRKVFEDIRGSQWDSFKQWAEEHNQDHNFIFQKAPLEIICKPTGSVLIARGMNNPGRAKSVPGLSLAWYEEADELSAEDFRQTSLSIRGDNIEEWLTFNSPVEGHWLLERFFPGTTDDKGKYTPDRSFETLDGMFTEVESTDKDAMIVHACYKHNPFNKQSFIDAQERDKEFSPESYRVSGLGLIGRIRTGMEFFHDFSEIRNVDVLHYDPERPIHITLDFNSAPYMTLLVSQIKQLPMGMWAVDFLKEYCFEHPLSTTKAVCEALAEDLKTGCFAGHRAGLFYYGDATGKNNSTMATEEVRHNYDTVEAILLPWMNNDSDRVLRSNPSHVKARDFMNAVFVGKMPIGVTFDKGMSTTIRDHINLKQGADGGILKEYHTDKAMGVRYEKWGHASQASYYLVIAAFPDIFSEFETLAR